MKWEIKAITEEKISKFITEYWVYFTPEEKRYMKELYLTICISNDKWQMDLDTIAKVLVKRKRQQGQEEEPEEDEPIEAESQEFEEENEPIEAEPQEPKQKKQFKYVKPKGGN